jgi:hypothetical protein
LHRAAVGFALQLRAILKPVYPYSQSHGGLTGRAGLFLLVHVDIKGAQQADLKRKLMRYIRHYNKAPRTVKWKYADPSRHISAEALPSGG